MALFRRSTATMPPLREWPGDAPEMPAVRAAVARKDADAVHAAVLAADPRHRFELVWAVASDLPYDGAQRLAEAHPDEPVASVLAGAAAVTTGWAVRTGERAEKVSSRQFKDFWKWLEQAEEHLTRAARADESDPLPMVYLLTSARGLQVPRAEVDARFAELVRRDPDHLEGHRQMLQYVCDKWFGSHEEMFAFARATSERVPVGSALHELLLFAHLEHYVALEGLDGGRRQQDYYDLPAVQAECAVAVERLGPLLEGPPDSRSVTARNHLLFIPWARRDRDGFDRALGLTGGAVSPMPWNYYGDDPVQVVRSAWKRLH